MKLKIISEVLAMIGFIIAMNLLVAFCNQKDTKYYPEIELLNNEYADTLVALHCVLPVYYYDWEETAASIGIDIEDMTIDLYIKHILWKND
jgi:hypothetical protein